MSAQLSRVLYSEYFQGQVWVLWEYLEVNSMLQQLDCFKLKLYSPVLISETCLPEFLICHQQSYKKLKPPHPVLPLIPNLRQARFWSLKKLQPSPSSSLCQRTPPWAIPSEWVTFALPSHAWGALPWYSKPQLTSVHARQGSWKLSKVAGDQVLSPLCVMASGRMAACT